MAENERELSNPVETTSVLTDMSDVVSSQDDVKIKVEIELKEEESGLIYETDACGHLKLVSLNQGSFDDGTGLSNNQTAVGDWRYPIFISETNEKRVSSEGNTNFNSEYVYGQLNIYNISEEMKKNFQSSIFATPDMFTSSHFAPVQHQFIESNQANDESIRKKKELCHILAEKKRTYRNKIKEENPAMWCAMKQKEACKKREQREEKRFILLEMQRLMHMTSLPDSPDDQKLYFESLKERYPDIWRQLLLALSAAEQRNSEILQAESAKRRLLKPAQMYKDVVEAQKKYEYRQRLKLERPDLYEQRKARESYARSIRRMMKKKLAESESTLDIYS